MSGVTTSRRALLAGAATVVLVAAGCGSPQEAATGGSGTSAPLHVGFGYSPSGRLATGTYAAAPGDRVKAVSAPKDLIGTGYRVLAGSTASGVALQVAPLAA